MGTEIIWEIAMTAEQREFFDANGYVMIEDAIEQGHLEHVQDAFLEGQAETRVEWEADGSSAVSASDEIRSWTAAGANHGHSDSRSPHF